MSAKKRVLLVEDHSFFSNEVKEFLEEECDTSVSTATSFLEAVKIIKKSRPFDFSFLDILLQNGKTGVDLVEKYKEKLGRVMFITGCIDETVLNKIKEHASVSKMTEIWPKLEEFISGGKPKITAYDSAGYKTTKILTNGK